MAAPCRACIRAAHRDAASIGFVPEDPQCQKRAGWLGSRGAENRHGAKQDDTTDSSWARLKTEQEIKMAPSAPSISDAELDVLKVLWDAGPGTVRDIEAQLRKRKRRWAYNTILTLLTRGTSQVIPATWRTFSMPSRRANNCCAWVSPT